MTSMFPKNPKIRAALISLVAAAFLCILKLATGMVTGSLAVLSSGIDSFLDILMSGINFIAIRRAEEPPDKKHPFGHGKFETVATFLQSLFIAGSGGWILYESYQRLQEGTYLSRLGSGMAVLFLGAVMSLFVSRVLKKAAAETDSSALEADSIHFSMDVYTNGALLAGLLAISFFGIPWLDPVLSILVGIYILIESFRLLRYVMRDFLDAELPEQLREKIVAIIEDNRECFVDYHHLRTRRAGSRKIMDFHLVVCRKITVEEAHAIADAMEKRIEEAVPGTDVTIHIEPCKETHCHVPGSCPTTSKNLGNPSRKCIPKSERES
jgi:cation diffusion facilitator family transporter